MNKKKLQKSARKQLEYMKAEFIQFKNKKEMKKSNKYGVGIYGR